MKNSATWLIGLFVLLLTFMVVDCGIISAASPVDQQERAFAWKRPFAFTPLCPGQVKPSGWLRDWALAAAEGYTGRMEEIHEEFVRAWTADFSPTCPVGDWPRGSWSYEGGAYWFDGLNRLAYQLDDDKLKALVARRMAPVLENARPEGIGYFYWLDRHNANDIESVHPDYGWGLWASGQYGRAMTAYYEATGDERALHAMKCADDSRDIRCISVVGLGSTGMAAMNACEDYARTGDTGVLETLQRVFEGRDVDYPELWEPYRFAPDEGLFKGEKCYKDYWVSRYHGVTINEALTGWMAGTLATGDPQYFETAKKWHKLLDERCMQPYGALVEDELYGPTGAYRCTETCTLSAELFRRTRMIAMTGDGIEADKAERLFFNAGANMVSRDFHRHVYFQQPNRVTKDAFLYSWGIKSNCTFQPTHYPLCCTAALNRVVPYFIQYCWMATPDKGLAAVMYAPNTLEAKVADDTLVKISTVTDYPFNETISMTVTTEKAVEFPLSVRIPIWCDNAKITVNGENITATPNEHGFAKIARTWNDGDKIELVLPMTPKVETGIDRNAKQIDMPEGGAWGKGSVPGMYADDELSKAPFASVSYGPLLFALGIAEIDENTPQPDFKWQFALDPTTALANAKVVRSPMPSKWNWPFDAPVKLEVGAVAAEWTQDDTFARLPAADEMKLGDKETLTLIPYGCAKLRVSMFPVVGKP